jgi:hypothetical protein
MDLVLSDKEKWINDQLDILREELNKNPVSFNSTEDIEKWLDKTDLIQVLTENFDFDYDIKTDPQENFSNEEFNKRFIELFQSLKLEIINNLMTQQQ